MTQAFRQSAHIHPLSSSSHSWRGGLFIDELERKPNGGKFPFFGVGCRHSGGHFPADTLHCVPALETVLIATSVLPERAPSSLGDGDAVDSLRRGAREPWIAAMIALSPTLLFVSLVYPSRSYEL